MGKGLDRQIAVYIGSLGISGVRVAGPPVGRPVRVVSGELPRNKGGATRPTLSVHSTIWFKSQDVAEMVAQAVCDELGDAACPGPAGWLDVSHETATESVRRVAVRLGASFQSNEIVFVAAQRAVETFETEFTEMQRRGDLAPVNKGYREYRLARTAAGLKTMSYAMYLWNYKVSLLKKLGDTSRSIDWQLFAPAGDMANVT